MSIKTIRREFEGNSREEAIEVADNFYKQHPYLEEMYHGENLSMMVSRHWIITKIYKIKESLFLNDYFKRLKDILWEYYGIFDSNESKEKIIQYIEYEIERKLSVSEKARLLFFIEIKDYNSGNRAWFEDYVIDIYFFIKSIN